MILEDWLLRFYYPIVDEFGYSVAEDASSAKTLAEFAELEKCSRLSFLRDKTVAVVGNGMERRAEVDCNSAVITAGKTVLWYDGRIDVHVTDLDEGFKAICSVADRAKVIVVHAHGDNEELIREYTPSLGKVIGTTQFLPFDGVYNFGGFTDGDRAAVIAKTFGGRVRLLNFDFCRADSELKLRKLAWAKRILEFEGILV